MLHFARAANIDSVHNQLILINQRINTNLRRDLPRIKPGITLSQYFDTIHDAIPICEEMAYKHQRYGQQQPQFSTQHSAQQQPRQMAPQQHQKQPWPPGKTPYRKPLMDRMLDDKQAHFIDFVHNGVDMLYEDDYGQQYFLPNEDHEQYQQEQNQNNGA